MHTEVVKIGKRGAFVIPASLRHQFGFDEGEMVIVEDHGDGILLKPAVTLPIEIYSHERKAEFLLSNAVSDNDYEMAKKEVIAMGLNPENVMHYRYSPKDKKGKSESKKSS